MRILIAEDDAPLASFVAKAFLAEEHECQIAADGEEALAKLDAESFDLLILDLILPRLSGVEVLRRIRTRDPELPILILTATDHVTERVSCLDAGADDYLTKPFSFSELSARVRALMRRKARPVQTLLRADDLELDCVLRTVRRSGKEIDLTPREFSLLEYLMRNSGHRVTRSSIIENVWKLPSDTPTNVVDVYVNYLRRKIDSGHQVKLIKTIRRIGYEFGVG
ncbi:MAG TPA: response regulator transcription factor [Candidatus Acidoferrales bacterium]|jgi:DNA-binding response OmpR family regulator|nr:response regulator transcription factor [Candidatus Acidoferrales bacterium]